MAKKQEMPNPSKPIEISRRPLSDKEREILKTAISSAAATPTNQLIAQALARTLQSEEYYRRCYELLLSVIQHENTCAACAGSLLPVRAVPRCEDCHPSEDQEADWKDKFQEISGLSFEQYAASTKPVVH